MFSHCYQIGNSVELYNGHNKNLFSKWKFSGRHTKVYDSTIKNYLHILDTGTLSKMELPGFTKGTLGIFQSYIVFQIYLFTNKQFSIEIAISDTTKTKRRLIFSTNNTDLIINQLHCRIPILSFPIGKWINYSVDILSFVSECFKDLTFRSIDYICISMSGKVREIFTMRNSLLTTMNNNSWLMNNSNDSAGDEIPSKYDLPGNVECDNINMNCNRVLSQIYIENQMHMNSNSNRYEENKIHSGKRALNSAGRNINNYTNKDKYTGTFKNQGNQGNYYNNSWSYNRMGNIGNMVMSGKKSNNYNNRNNNMMIPNENNINTGNYIYPQAGELCNQREFVNVNNFPNNDNYNLPDRSNEGYIAFNKEEYVKKFQKDNCGNEYKLPWNNVSKSQNELTKKTKNIQEIQSKNIHDDNNNINTWNPIKMNQKIIEDTLGIDNIQSSENNQNIVNQQISTIKNENDERSDFEIPWKDFSPPQMNTEMTNKGVTNMKEEKKKIIEETLEDSSHAVFQDKNANMSKDINDHMNSLMLNDENARPFTPPIENNF